MGTRVLPRSGPLPGGGSRGVRRARAQGPRPLRGGRRHPPGGHAARMRGHRVGHQPRRLVHPALHPALPAPDGGKDPPPPGPLPAGSGVRRGVPEGAGDREGERPPSPSRAPRARRRWGARSTVRFRPRAAGVERGLSVASPRLGAEGAGGSAPGARLALPDLRGVRAGETQGPPRSSSAAAEALPVALPRAPRAGPAGKGVRGGAQRGAGPPRPGGSPQPALGRQAHGGVSLGAHRRVRTLPGRDPAPEDALALQAGRQAGAARDGAPGRRERGGFRARAGGAEKRRRRRPRWRRRPRRWRRPTQRRNHEPERRPMPVLRRHRDHAGPAGARARGEAPRAHDGGRCSASKSATKNGGSARA